MPNEPEESGCFQRQVSLKGVLGGGNHRRMVLHLDLETHTSLKQIRGFLTGNSEGAALVPERKQSYAHIGRVLQWFSCSRLGKPDQGLLRRYLVRTTGLLRAQLGLLVARYLAEGQLGGGRWGAGKPLRLKYRREGVLLLAVTDELRGRLSSPTTLAICKRA